MIADSTSRGAAFATMPMSIVLRDLSASFLYAVAAIYGLFNLVGLGGFPSLFPVLVPGEQLDRANALEGVSYTLASPH